MDTVLKNKISDISNNINNDTTDLTQMDTFQTEFDCCGAESNKDWNSYKIANGYYPPSCCSSEITTTCNRASKHSCVTAIGEYFGHILGQAAFLIVVHIVILGFFWLNNYW